MASGEYLFYENENPAIQAISGSAGVGGASGAKLRWTGQEFPRVKSGITAVTETWSGWRFQYKFKNFRRPLQVFLESTTYVIGFWVTLWMNSDHNHTYELASMVCPLFPTRCIRDSLSRFYKDN